MQIERMILLNDRYLKKNMNASIIELINTTFQYKSNNRLSSITIFYTLKNWKVILLLKHRSFSFHYWKLISYEFLIFFLIISLTTTTTTTSNNVRACEQEQRWRSGEEKTLVITINVSARSPFSLLLQATAFHCRLIAPTRLSIYHVFPQNIPQNTYYNFSFKLNHSFNLKIL